ncbi:MAG: hypothetical protein Unbinned4162contig1001_68 [Prokaryotic dsDNA virus sp.]|nr:MAG: hypothetical protein Unbinned4162contig1001_68 [Prokaryotic dsDNA virus sp.]|tara:strand:- start:40850 stop:41707 length:858 start_codon:yes stop_codon:yes gene_type:complete
MAYTNGTATDYLDLMDKLRAFASANGWTVERWNNPAPADPAKPMEADYELFLYSNGDGSDNIYCNFGADYSNSSYKWLMSNTPNTGAGTVDAQPSANPETYVYLWQNSIDYYFFCDAYHIKGIMQVSGTSHCFYMGRIKPYCSKGHWPIQLTCFGEGVDSSLMWNSQSAGLSNMASIERYSTPSEVGQFLRFADGIWHTPYLTYPNDILFRSTDMVASPSGKVPSFPYTFYNKDLGMVGELFGVYGIFLDDVGTFTQLDIDGKTYITCQNVYRTGPNHMIAMELV